MLITLSCRIGALVAIAKLCCAQGPAPSPIPFKRVQVSPASDFSGNLNALKDGAAFLADGTNNQVDSVYWTYKEGVNQFIRIYFTDTVGSTVSSVVIQADGDDQYAVYGKMDAGTSIKLATADPVTQPCDTASPGLTTQTIYRTDDTTTIFNNLIVKCLAAGADNKCAVSRIRVYTSPLPTLSPTMTPTFAPPPSPTGAWTHDMSTIKAQSWVLFSGPGRRWPKIEAGTEEYKNPLKWVANNYAIAYMSNGFANNDPVYAGQSYKAFIQGATEMKGHNPNLKVGYYFNSRLPYASLYEWGDEFLSHDEWLFRNDAGSVEYAPFWNTSGLGNSAAYHDLLNDDFLEWFSDQVTNVKNQSHLFDTIFVDNAKAKDSPFTTVNACRNEEYWYALQMLLNETRFLADERLAPGNRVAVNVVSSGTGLGHDDGYSSFPYVDMVVVEMLNGFKLVDNGALNPEKYHKQLEAVLRYTSGGKNVLIRGWPGPFVDLDLWDASYSEPTPTSNTGKAIASAEWMEGTLAAYLIMASELTYFSYAWWWKGDTGTWPCDDSSDPNVDKKCTAPQNWYPEWTKPLGPALGPYSKTGWVYTRSFQYADVIFNAEDVKGSTINWHA